MEGFSSEWTPALAVGTLLIWGVKNFKQHQKRKQAVASPCLGNFHGVRLQSHVPFHHLHWLPTACPLAQLPWTHTQGKDRFQSFAFPWCGSYHNTTFSFSSTCLQTKAQNPIEWDMNMPKWNRDLLLRGGLTRIVTECQLVSPQFLVFLEGPLCCISIWPAFSWPLTKPHFQLFSYVRCSILSGGSQWEPLGWGWRPLCQWCCDWKDTRVHASPLGT